MGQDEIQTRLTYLEKATNRLAEDMSKQGKGKGSRSLPEVKKAIVIPAGGIRIKLPAYDVHYQGTMQRVNVVRLENDPELYAHMRLKHPTIFIE